MIKKIIIILTLILIAISPKLLNNSHTVKAESLTDNIEEQLNNIDLSELEDYFNNISNKQSNLSFKDIINDLLNGEYELNFNTILEQILQVTLSNVYDMMPTFATIFLITFFCGIMQNFKSSFLSDSISDLIFFVCFLTVILLLSLELSSIISNTRNVIENIANLTEIMSPIILTLIVASGGKVSAAIYKPTVVFLSVGVINIVLSLIIPLVVVLIIFNVISNLSTTVKLTKFSELISSIIKWIVGIVVTVFSCFLTIQGISSASFDGLSAKAAKYVISNSVPIIGGFIKDGFNVVVAGSILIKNAVGVACVFGLFYTIISPLIEIIIFSLLLKAVSAIIEPFSDSRICNFCSSVSKSLSYITMSLLMVGLMFFIVITLMIVSGNALV